MKIWGNPNGGNPVRVAIFLAEKGIHIPFESVDLMQGEQRSATFLARNPAAQVPVLELDDGTYLSETVAICRYFERLHPAPALMGRSPIEEATIEMWQRRLELGLYYAARAVMRHSVSALKALEPVQIAEWAELNRGRVTETLKLLEPQLAVHPFIAGPEFSIADITAVLPFQIIQRLGIQLPPDCPSLATWRDAIFSRPCVARFVQSPLS